jgi:hypothetical protein
MCDKLIYRFYGFRKAASAWEEFHVELFESEGFVRGLSCGVALYHKEPGISVVVHGDDFTLCGGERELDWITELRKSWFTLKVRATLGPDEWGD